MKAIILKYIQIIVLSITLTGCATNPSRGISSSEGNADYISSINPDPYEHINRKIFKFNEEFDDKILIPFAKGYRKYLPRPVRIAIYNFFSNTAEGRNLVNSLLQGKLHNAVDTFSRLFINSTFGLLGMIDIATQSGLERRVEDIGQTLAVWGAGFGPYIVIPILGPSSGRDALGLISYFTYEDPLGYLKDTTARVALLTLDLVDTRSRYLRASSVFGFAAVDPYLFARESYFQQRRDFIYDGKAPIENFDNQ